MKALFALPVTFILFTIAAQCQNCDSTLWKYVYKPHRLEVLKDCITATGIIKKASKKPDGDWHVDIQLDAGQEALLNSRNPKGYFIAEVICANTSWQPGTVRICKRCKDCRHRITVPKKGAHIKLTGTFVKDKWHGWNEIHPVSAIEIL